MLEYKQKRNNGRTPFDGVYKFVCVCECTMCVCGRGASCITVCMAIQGKHKDQQLITNNEVSTKHILTEHKNIIPNKNGLPAKFGWYIASGWFSAEKFAKQYFLLLSSFTNWELHHNENIQRGSNQQYNILINTSKNAKSLFKRKQK